VQTVLPILSCPRPPRLTPTLHGDDNRQPPFRYGDSLPVRPLVGLPLKHKSTSKKSGFNQFGMRQQLAWYGGELWVSVADFSAQQIYTGQAGKDKNLIDRGIIGQV